MRWVLDPVVLEYTAHPGYCCWLPSCVVFGTKNRGFKRGSEKSNRWVAKKTKRRQPRGVQHRRSPQGFRRRPSVNDAMKYLAENKRKVGRHLNQLRQRAEHLKGAVCLSSHELVRCAPRAHDKCATTKQACYREENVKLYQNLSPSPSLSPTHT